MRLAVFGLSITSSWGNGHATLWRGLVRALVRRGCRVSFFERNEPYYAGNRDLTAIPGAEIVLYDEWEDVRTQAHAAIREADAAIVTSYCRDGLAAAELMFEGGRGLAVFYDLDTPVTLSRLGDGERVDYIGPRGLRDFDLVLSYTGSRALDELQQRLGARRAVPLYGHVDPEVHRPVPPVDRYRADLSYFGTYAADRQGTLEALFMAPARECPSQRFVIGGAQYPADFPWSDNIYFVQHLPPSEHPAFFSSSRLTLNVTRRAMADMGWCPSGRLFEAAACGTPIVSDVWPGLESFFEPGREILLAQDTDDVLAALDLSDTELDRIARAARQRTLTEHTSDHRAAELVEILSRTSKQTAEPEGLPFPLPTKPAGDGPAKSANVSSVAPTPPRFRRASSCEERKRRLTALHASNGRGPL